MIQEIIMAENHVLVKLSCSLYAEEAAQVSESLLEYIEKGHKTILFDFGDVDYIEYSGLQAFVAFQKRARQNGGSVVIQGLHGLVKDLFELTRLDKVFEIQ